MFCVLEDLFTTVERTLVANGQEDLVRAVRLAFQESVSARFRQAVGDVTGREVLAYHSQVTFHPPLGFEIFVLAE
jgi:uncharacterized protein YbcI